MKAADMVLQSELVAHWADGRRLAFLGDGDSISVCVAYLRARAIVGYGPTSIKVFDFDERMVNAIKRFADKERLDTLDAELYNCLDALPTSEQFDSFYTNPPWGASNAGSSVNAFVQRGAELLHYEGDGLVVMADDPSLDWTKTVLANVQAHASELGFYVSRLMPQLHSYHLDDNPDLRSCNLFIRSRPENGRVFQSEALTDVARLRDFYGSGLLPDVRYVREKKRVDYGKAHDDEYALEHYEEK